MHTDPRFPVGKFIPQAFSDQQLEEWLRDIKLLPLTLENAILNLDHAQLQTPYRENGWTVQQLVHHIADSHMNAYIRFKLGVTETHPTIRPYDEKLWANLPDTENIPINISITLLHALHIRWHETLANIQAADWNRTVVHPDHEKPMSLWFLLGMYAWHGKHHVAHITALRERKNW